MDAQTVPPQSAVEQLQAVLDSPEIRELVEQIEGLRWTGRPGYGVRAMVGMMLAKSIYAIPTWSKATRLVAEHPALQAVIGCAPSQWAAYRFCRTLREHSGLLADCLDATLAGLAERLPDLGREVAIDASDLPAYANGQRLKSKNGPERKAKEYSDPDASWGHRSAVSTRKGGGFYGYRIHAAVDVATDLPLAWRTETARENETNFVFPLIERMRDRGLPVKVAIMDKGYDQPFIHDGCMDRGVTPVTPLRQTPAVKRGDAEPRRCEHGVWTFAGRTSSAVRPSGAARPGECQPASVWVKADRLHPLVPPVRPEPQALPLPRRGGAGVQEDSRTNGRSPRSASEGSSGCGCTPT